MKGRYAGDIVEMQGRCGGDMVEISGRYGGDIPRSESVRKASCPELLAPSCDTVPG